MTYEISFGKFTSFSEHVKLEINRYIGQADIWVLPIYRYRPKRPQLAISAQI